MTPKQLAEKLIEKWTCGTDLLDNLPEWVISDLQNKLEREFEYSQQIARELDDMTNAWKNTSKHIERLQSEREEWRIRDEQWRIKYTQAMDTWAADGVRQNQLETELRETIVTELQRNTILRADVEKEVQKTADAYRAQHELKQLVIATHEHLLPLLRLYGEKDDHPVIRAVKQYVASIPS